MKKISFIIVTGLMVLFLLYRTSESYAVNAQQAYIEITWAQEAIADKESQGYDVSKAKKILEEARQAYRLDKYRKAAKLAGKVRKMFVKEAMREAGIKKSLPAPLHKALGHYGLPTPGIPIKRQFAIAPKPKPAGAPKSKLSGDDEYYILYATFKSWGMDFNELYDTYSKKALAEGWPAFWIGSTENTAQRVYFDCAVNKCRPRMSDLKTSVSPPASIPEIPPKPDSLLASDAKAAAIPVTKCQRIAVFRIKDAPDASGSGEVVTNLIIEGLMEKGYNIVEKEEINREMKKVIPDAEYHILYATFKNWGIDFNNLYDVYSKKALAENWTTWWIGSATNTAQRVHFDRVGDKWKPRMSDLAMPGMIPMPVPVIPPKPASLLASEEQKAKGSATPEEEAILSVTKSDLIAQGAADETAALLEASLHEAARQKRDIRESTIDPVQIGRALGANAVVAGHLFHYGDITRHHAGILTPAAGFTSLAGEGVDLEIKIIDTATGSIIWRDRYTHTPTAEQAFTGFGKAMKAESIAQEVVKALLDKISERKEETQ